MFTNHLPAAQRREADRAGAAHANDRAGDVLVLHAGIDQFGGANDPAPILDAVARKLVSEKRIDDSVRRVLRLKLEQGLFDNPYVDEAAAAHISGSERCGEA